MKEPTMEEVLTLVSFNRHRLDGSLVIDDVFSYVSGSVLGNVSGDVEGNVGGNVFGNIGGGVEGTINGRKWKFVVTRKEKAIRLIREGKSEEAIKVLQEVE